ncbi:DUF2927 domain-containing protein [Nocardioides sp.]|uniref:DUF2927 domain-containing protein n=1 Tax=Nocardioides sp. TaxID=35761 RepID=UPI002735CE95|nr:DUF2927 domain-containing protein [Nocardioides sp.]MDP3892419.1 DUF2927 domain-containing protein [Nocardioides sp.]
MIRPHPRPAPARPALFRAGLAALAALGLAGCIDAGMVENPSPPALAPMLPLPEPAPVPVSAASAEMRSYFALVAQQLRSQGLLRTEIAPRDAPFSARQLADNFVRIALYDEYYTRGGAIVARQSVSRLRRWEAPVRMSIEFGASVPLAQRNADRATIGTTAARIGRASGHPVTLSEASPNFTVMVLNETERRNIGPRLTALVPGIDPAAVRAVTALPPTTFCVVFAFSEGDSSTYTRAVAVIRGEHPDILRQSCFHEELAQGMGLANDSHAARPSIFNDDEEFALLTRHDELLLRILYDPRLTPGMTEAEARPLINTIAAALVGGQS